MSQLAIWMVSWLWFGQLAAADTSVLTWDIDMDLETSYRVVYQTEEAVKGVKCLYRALLSSERFKGACKESFILSSET